MQAQDNKDNHADKALRLVQLTDPHLFASPGETLVGMDCRDSFHQVLQLVRRQQAGLDLLVCTGDVSQDHSAESYRLFHQALSTFGVPWFCIPGNHDEQQVLHATLGADNACLSKIHDVGAWRLVMLDSTVPGQPYGRLEQRELDFLERALGDCAAGHALVCLHHNPLPVRAAWLQKHALRNSDDFLSVIDRHPCVRGVIWGHIHQEYDAWRNGVRMLASPSTCIQFHPDSQEFRLDERNPGYRWLDLRPDGRIDTAVERLEGRPFDIDFSGTGY